MYDILIIGGGPAGLSAALYAARAGKRVGVLEKFFMGGQLASIGAIENYPAAAKTTGPDLAMEFSANAEKFGAEFLYDDIVKADWKTKTLIGASGTAYTARAVILATGAEPKPLGLPKEEALKGHGVSYCATCDGAFFKGKDVAVAGSSKIAAEEALFLTAHAAKVYLIANNHLPRTEVVAKGVALVQDSTVTALAEENSMLCGVTVTDTAGNTRDIALSGLFVSVGMMPANRLCGEIALSPSGHILTDETLQTSVPGVFAAGDIREKTVRQVVTAAADGAIAAISALKMKSA